MVEKGITKHWTPKAERVYRNVLNTCQSFAERQLIQTIFGLVKYDGRTKGGKRAKAQLDLQLAIATDDEVKEMAQLLHRLLFKHDGQAMEERVERLKQRRALIQQDGIKKARLEI